MVKCEDKVNEIDKRMTIVEMKLSFILKSTFIIIAAIIAAYGVTTWVHIPRAVKTQMTESSVVALMADMEDAHNKAVNQFLPEINSVASRVKSSLQAISSGEVYYDDEKDFKKSKDQLIAKKKISFATPYSEIPHVVAAFSRLNFRGGGDVKVDLKISNIKNTGFDLQITTWDDAFLWSAAVSWIAYP